jgi:predicted metal-dependent HD superfamily phosphohydrolase
MRDPALVERFAALWRRLGGRGSGAEAADAVLAAWDEPHRVYHDLQHLRDCLARLDEAPAAGHERDLAEAALWYHDLVYRPGAADNEARSARAAHTALVEGGAGERTADEVARLVGLTDHVAPPPDRVAALVCDVDLSILGRPAEEFAAYERRIREEYRQVPEEVYRLGRRRVLERLLARDRLFATPHFHDRYEAPARRNLRHSLETLAGANRA